MVDTDTGRVLIDPETLKPREYVDPVDYTQGRLPHLRWLPMSPATRLNSGLPRR